MESSSINHTIDPLYNQDKRKGMIRMSYKCRVCGFNDVEEENGICDFCAMGRDPYAEAMHNRSEDADDMPIEKNNTSEHPSTTYVPAHGKRKRVLLNAGNTDGHKSTVLSDNDMTMDSAVNTLGAISV